VLPPRQLHIGTQHAVHAVLQMPQLEGPLHHNATPTRDRTPGPPADHIGAVVTAESEDVQHRSGPAARRQLQRAHRWREPLSTRPPRVKIRTHAEAFDHSRTFHPHIMTDPPKPEPESSASNTATSTTRKQWAGTRSSQEPRSTPQKHNPVRQGTQVD